MPFSIDFDNELYAIRVTMTGNIDATEVEKVFREVYTGQYPSDINAIWSFEGQAISTDVMQVFELAKFTQSRREIDGRPATAFVAYDEKARSLCEEYKLLVREAPYDVKIFSDITSAEQWLLERKVEQVES